MTLFDYPVLLFFVSIAAMLLVHEVGYRARTLTKERKTESWERLIRDTRNQIGLLLSLLLGFAMSMGLSMYNQRGQLIVDEANAIQLADLRAGLQAGDIRTAAPPLLREYVDTRIAVLEQRRSNTTRVQAAARAKSLQRALWQQAHAEAQTHPTPVLNSYADALGQIVAKEAEQTAANDDRVPTDIWILLSVLALMVTGLVGYGQERRMALVTFIPVLMIATAFCLLSDLSSPVSGFINVGEDSLRAVSAALAADAT